MKGDCGCSGASTFTHLSNTPFETPEILFHYCDDAGCVSGHILQHSRPVANSMRSPSLYTPRPTPQGANSVNLDRLIKVPAKAVKLSIDGFPLLSTMLRTPPSSDRSYDESEPRPAPPWLPSTGTPPKDPWEQFSSVPVYVPLVAVVPVQPQRRSPTQFKTHLTSPTTTSQWVGAIETRLYHICDNIVTQDRQRIPGNITPVA
ncbi:hypothetical protein BDP55DRAFT_632119 [Colletotrichum godetiae]|uniref:Uncharacterized protein n=1 Tax=Colletotrichum godetiae TaxID=1209918 RepID=A0AAJ0AKB4_9PEZI|nr:uncharacterized protein BDP55DRAFT_632119 [Colletotrichum godetiae]KAK1675435.1 hypothetical protein BDP55DRAFT_632119 [Colletotrichum godetiae]